MIDFLEVRGLSADILNLTRKELLGKLEDFYCDVRMRDGEFYKKNSLLKLRQCIYRYFKENGSNIDIICDPDIAQANNCFLRCWGRPERKEKVPSPTTLLSQWTIWGNCTVMNFLLTFHKVDSTKSCLK